MKNMNLNIGGVVGAIACGGIAVAIIFLTVDIANGGRGPFKLAIGALIGGAFAGNFLWGLIFKESE